MKQTIAKAAIMGSATLGSALLLQQFYKVANFYPPKPVFWFFMGVNATITLALINYFSGGALPALSTFGASDPCSLTSDEILRASGHPPGAILFWNSLTNNGIPDSYRRRFNCGE